MVSQVSSNECRPHAKAQKTCHEHFQGKSFSATRWFLVSKSHFQLEIAREIFSTLLFTNRKLQIL